MKPSIFEAIAEARKAEDAEAQALMARNAAHERRLAASREDAWTPASGKRLSETPLKRVPRQNRPENEPWQPAAATDEVDQARAAVVRAAAGAQK